MSDQEIGKKLVERSELELFIDAYEWITGGALSIIEADESPDFICERPDGSRVGVELTKITRDKNVIFAEKVLDRKYEIDAYEASDYIHYLLERKEENRATNYVLKVAKNILVLQLVDGTLDNIMWVFDGLQNDFVDHGFEEVWLADYSGYKAYGDIELFGLYPECWWGYHQRPCPYRKPYG
ncbi:MAG: hypothetical protein ABSC54_01255 [Smithellaceae bacterium]|jgi:hypothetical protein